MFDFEDLVETIKLLISWLCLSALMPVYWWLMYGENILFQMLRRPDGWVYFAICFLLAVTLRPILNRIVRCVTAQG